MKIIPNIQIIDLALLVESNLIISDIHIGYEEALNKQGVLVPRQQFDELAKNMNKIFGKLGEKKVDKIIVNGDLKHEFGTISELEWRNTLKFIDLLAKNCRDIILVKGNHDTILGPIAKKRNVKVVDSQFIVSKEGNVLVLHGDKEPNKELLKDVSSIIIGHEHPAVSLSEGPRAEVCKCFLKGKYKGKNLIVQPSFNNLIEGTNVLREKILSPLIKNIYDFEVIVIEDKIYDFGKLRNLKN